jgi:hypothetical protein
MSILRLGFLLVLVGLVAPIGCNLNGYQIAQGMMGKGTGNAMLLHSIGGIYGYALIGVFLFAFVGLLLTFVGKLGFNFLLGFICLVVSFILLTIVAHKLISQSEQALTHFLTTFFRIKVKILIGGYFMAIGYLAGVVAFFLRAFQGTLRS